MKRLASLLALAALASATRDARAQSFVDSTPQSAEAPPLSSRSVRLFDERRTGSGLEIKAGPIWIRKVQDTNHAEDLANAARRLGEISLGTATTTPKGIFYITGVQKTLVRFLGASSFSWSIFQQDLGGGLMLGPLEPEVRIGLSILSIDYVKGEFSAQLFSPRTSVGLGLHLGKIKLDMSAHSEYLWRWFGPDYLSHGVTLGLRLDLPRPTSPFKEARP